VPLRKIVSGGQTGVDRGALDAALAAGFCCGGWCPPGRLSEDGVIDMRYPLAEIPKGGYNERTLKNVTDSDATLIIYFSELHGGTEKTVLYCIKQHKPYKLIDATETTAARAAELTAQFVARHEVSVLNVAGPRQSHAPAGHEYAAQTIGHLLRGET
jgi:putative molybdenum carrier protein